MKTVAAGVLGECVHATGVSKFLRLAEQADWKTVFLGPAVLVEQMIAAICAARAPGGQHLPANGAAPA